MRFLLPFSCLTVGFVLGLSLHRAREKPVVMEAAPPVPAAVQPAPISQREAASSAPNVSALDRLRALTSLGAHHCDIAQAALLIDQLQLADCKAAIPLFRKLNRNDCEILLDTLARRWARLDPVDAFNNAQATRRDNDWSNRIGYAAGAALAERYPEAALERITSARNNDLREKAAEWILPAMAKSHGRRAAEFLSSNALLTRHEHIYRNVAQEFGRSSPAEAIAWANSLTNKRLREQSVSSAWQGWAEIDPRAVVAAMESDPEAKQNASVISTVASNWSRLDFKAALAWIESIPDPGKRNGAYGSIQIDTTQLSREDSRQLLFSINSDHTRNEFAEKIGQQLARESVHDALAWAESLPSDKSRSHAMNSILKEWTATDPAATARYVTSQPESKERSSKLAHVMNLWSEADSDAARAFAESLPSGHERDTALGSIVETISENEPQKALALFQSLQDPEVVGRLAHNFLRTLIKSDPAAALQIASQIPAEAQPRAYHALVRSWAFDQPQQAGDWLNALAPGAPRDSAVKAYVSVIDGMDPALATKWAYSIQEPTERIEATFSAFNRWLEKDKTAAGAWVEQTEIPEGFRPYFDRLLKDEKWAREYR